MITLVTKCEVSDIPTVLNHIQSFATEFSFALLENDAIIMHATVNADRDLHSGVFDVDDTSFLPKVCARNE